MKNTQILYYSVALVLFIFLNLSFIAFHSGGCSTNATPTDIVAADEATTTTLPAFAPASVPVVSTNTYVIPNGTYRVDSVMIRKTEEGKVYGFRSSRQDVWAGSTPYAFEYLTKIPSDEYRFSVSKLLDITLRDREPETTTATVRAQLGDKGGWHMVYEGTTEQLVGAKVDLTVTVENGEVKALEHKIVGFELSGISVEILESVDIYSGIVPCRIGTSVFDVKFPNNPALVVGEEYVLTTAVASGEYIFSFGPALMISEPVKLVRTPSSISTKGDR